MGSKITRRMRLMDCVQIKHRPRQPSFWMGAAFCSFQNSL